MITAKEKAKEIHSSVLNTGKGFISEHLAMQLSLLLILKLNEQAEETFHKYGIGYMGNAIARNDYSKSSISKYWEEVKKEVKKLK